MLLEEESSFVMGLILATLLLIFILYMWFLIKTRHYEYGQNRWKKYIKSINPSIEKEIYDKIQNLSDEDFKSYLMSMQKKINYKYRTRKKGLKNTVLNDLSK